jgi:hypothetical protein
MKTHTDSTSPLHRTKRFWRKSRSTHFFCYILFGLLSSGCGVLREKKTPQADPAIVQATQKPMSPDAASSVFSEMGENWLYGPGLGQTALNVGAMVVFPPYAIYVLGNSVLSMSGYEPLYVTDLLPEGERDEVNLMYDEVTTAPGRVSAALAGKEFRSKEVASERMKAIVAEGAAAPEREKPRGG